MNSSFYTGVSGIKSGQFGIDVLANNISNISTIGYKSNSPEFSTLFTTALTDSYFDSTTNNAGVGSQSQTVATDMSQGILQDTDNTFDLAIRGEGWFGVQGFGRETFYTRAGAFSVDSQGNMVDGNGNYLLGTSGENITATVLNNDVLEEFGTYYRTDSTELGQAYSISALSDIQLGTIETQSIINLPDILYFPPEATTYVNYQANLNPKITIASADITLNSIDILSDIDTNSLLNVNGTVSNTDELQNPKKDDTVILNITDIDGKSLIFKTTLDENLNWSISNQDLSDLNLTEDPSISAILQTVQEIPNEEHFSTEVIAASGNKQFIDMTFTKRVPQNALTTTWDSNIKLLEFYEDYKVEFYNPNTIYDENIYQINDENTQVTKIYDPLLYHIDTSTDKVYRLIDTQIGTAVFSGSGNLISEDIPSLTTESGTLDLNIGTPYSQQNLTTNEAEIDGNNITLSGANSGLNEGESITIKVTDIDGRSFQVSTEISNDGSWSTSYETTTLNTSEPLTVEAFNIVNSGFDGIISHVDLEKQKISDKDGYYEGLLNAYGMDGNGNVVAEFDNGRSAVVAKVAVYHFQNDQGLENVSSTLFKASDNSGSAIFYTDENGNNILGSSIDSYKLEGSNVSLATALTELIILQKSFDSSAKCITTSNEMIQNAINMKR